MPTRQDVAQFLSEFKAALSLHNPILEIRSDPAKAHFSGLGITQNQAIKYLQALTPDDYNKGPEPDHTDPKLLVWFFGKDIGGTEAYIKLTLVPDSRKRHVTYPKIWSFHAAEGPLQYPLRGSS